MLTDALALLSRLAAWLRHDTRSPAAPTPLDPVERLQRDGGGLPLMLEFARPVW